MDALHVYAGILLHLLAALALRRSLASPWPWLAVAAAIAANEYYDYHYEVWPVRSEQVDEAIKDGWNTLLVPTVLFLAVRFASFLFRPSADPGEPRGERGQSR
jgi:hypothetical protein